MIDENVFAPGKIEYNCFSISFEKPFDQQLESLTEDLILVRFEHEYAIDVGWYPELDPNGYLIVQLIKNEDWNNPVEKTTVANLNEMFEAIKRMKLAIGINNG